MKVEVDLTKALLGDKYWNEICEAFKIPVDKRYESWIPQAILERVRTYLQGYIGRRSIEERENGAAFIPPVPFPVGDLDVVSSALGQEREQKEI